MSDSDNTPYSSDVMPHLRAKPMRGHPHGASAGLRDAERALREIDARKPAEDELEAIVSDLASNAGQPDPKHYGDAYVAAFTQRFTSAQDALAAAKEKREARLLDAESADARAAAAREAGEREVEAIMLKVERARSKAEAEARRHEAEAARQRQLAAKYGRPALADARFVR